MDKVIPYFSFRGRANRQRYWLTVLATYALLLIVLLPSMIIPVVGWVIGGLALLAALWVAVATAIRRLHDRGKSAWWLIPMYVPLVLLSLLATAAQGGGEPEAGAGFSVLSMPFSLWILIELGFLRGSRGENKFGPDPLAPAPAEVFA